MTRWVFVLLLPVALSAQQVRDNAPSSSPRTGSARISGVVLTDEGTPVPIRAAIVTVAGDGLGASRTSITDDEGRFVVNALPAGRFTLSVRKAPFITTMFGATRPGAPGKAIALAAGQQMTNVTLKLARGAVITGRVIDATTGAPMTDIPLSIMRVDTAEVAPGAPPPSQTTDDRGMYRLFGLLPGEYVVSATAQTMTSGEVWARSEADVDAALAALRQRPKVVGTTPPASGAPLATRPPSRGYAPIYYPGTALISDATRIRLAAGEERTSIDIPMSLVRTATVDGIVSSQDGVLPPISMVLTSQGDAARVPMFSLGTVPSLTPVGPDGRFSYAAVPPGRYVITARTTSGAAGRGPGASIGASGAGSAPAGGASGLLWAAADIVVDGEDVHGVALVLQPGIRFRGRIETDSPSSLQAPPEPTAIRVGVVREGSGGSSSMNGTVMGLVPVPAVQGKADGSFEVLGILPGTYRLSVNVPGGRWWLRSAMVDGRDVLDVPLTFGNTSDVSGATLVFTDGHSELAGTLQDATGAGVSDYVVVVFSADPALWRADSRRLKWTKPATDGAFAIPDLPPGDYWMAALTDFDPIDARDPSFFERLSAAAIKVTMGNGERKRQDIRMAR